MIYPIICEVRVYTRHDKRKVCKFVFHLEDEDDGRRFYSEVHLCESYVMAKSCADDLILSRVCKCMQHLGIALGQISKGSILSCAQRLIKHYTDTHKSCEMILPRSFSLKSSLAV